MDSFNKWSDRIMFTMAVLGMLLILIVAGVGVVVLMEVL